MVHLRTRGTAKQQREQNNSISFMIFHGIICIFQFFVVLRTPLASGIPPKLLSQNPANSKIKAFLFAYLDFL
jgi:hypothetical protein